MTEFYEPEEAPEDDTLDDDPEDDEPPEYAEEAKR